MLEEAVQRRLKGHSKDLSLFVALGFAAVILGAAIFAVLWLRFRTDETEVIAQFASLATTLVTAGVGGAFVTRVISLRQEIRTGQEWLMLYEAALGPPPDELVPDIREKILDWLDP